MVAELTSLVVQAPLLVVRGRSTPLSSAAPSECVQLEHYRRWSASSSLFGSVTHIAITHVRQRDGVAYYVVSVYLSLPSSRLPSGVNASPTAQSQRPSVAEHDDNGPVWQIERRYSDFDRLRNRVVDIVTAYPPCHCSYCLSLLAFFRFRWSIQPCGLKKLATNPERRRRLLDAFLNSLIRLAQAPPARQSDPHNGRHAKREWVQAVMEAFLLST